MAPSTRPSRAGRRRDRNRAALLEAALELFQQRGLRATRLEEICERADVAPRTFFNHFASREQLYQTLAGQRAEGFAALVDALGRDPRPLPERLCGLFAGIARYLGERPLYRELVGAMLALGADGGSEAARSRTLGRAAQRFVAGGVARGEVTRRHPPEVLADLLIGALQVALVNWSADEDYDLAGELARSALALGDLLRPEAGESAPSASREGARP